VGDIRDISKRTGNFSKTITLVGNSNNNNLLNHYYDVNIQAGTFNINQLTSCDVIQDGIPVMTNATLQLINIKKSQLTSAYEQMVEYEVLIKEDRGTFFTDISNKYLNDIDFSDLDHYVDAQVVIDTFDYSVTEGYKYVMPYNIDNQYQFNWFKPAIYAKNYFDRIFATAGYSYTWDGLVAAKFNKLLIPYNGDQNIVDWSDYEVKAEISNVTKTFTPANPAGSQMVKPWQYTTSVPGLQSITGYTETLDQENIFNPSTGNYSTPQWVGNGSGESYVYEVTLDYDFILNCTQECYVYQPNLNYKTNLGLRFSAQVDGSDTNVVCFSNPIPLAIYNSANYLVVGDNAILSRTEVFTFNATTNGTGGIDVNDLQIVRMLVKSPDSAGIQFSKLTNLNLPFELPTAKVVINSLKLKIRPSDNIPLNSGVTTMNNFIPEKIKQSDFIKSIFTMYNLYATANPDNQNNLILISRDEYYDAGKAVDWTNKLMKDKEQSIIFIPELNNKKLRLTYKADTDSPNTVYTGITNEIYGQVEVTFDNEYVKGIDVKELIFSPTPVQPTEFGAFLPLLNGAAPKTNIRILFDNGQVTAQNVVINSGQDTQTSTAGVYPYLSHFGGTDPFNPIFDLNFAPAQYYYYQVAQNTNNNLYNKYWRRTVAQINGGKLLTAYFYLRETDIQYMELNDKIRIDNSWWSINKIIDYNANDLVPTKVELISLETEIDLPNFG
jgi:hypothetical protein